MPDHTTLPSVPCPIVPCPGVLPHRPLPERLLAALATATPELVVAADEPGAGHWAGAPYAVHDGDRIVLANRVRKPEGRGRGLANIIAVSDDGLTFREVARVESGTFGAASLERPALARLADGGWRLYVSCSTPGLETLVGGGGGRSHARGASGRHPRGRAARRRHRSVEGRRRRPCPGR